MAFYWITITNSYFGSNYLNAHKEIRTLINEVFY